MTFLTPLYSERRIFHEIVVCHFNYGAVRLGVSRRCGLRYVR